MYPRQQAVARLKQLTQLIRNYSSARLCENKENLILDIQKQQEVFPLVWLRDNCKCTSCFHEHSTSRIIKWIKFDTSPKVSTIEITNDNNLVLQWHDKHISKFSIDWLKERSFREDSQQKYLQENYRPARIPWSQETFDAARKVYEYEDIMKNDHALYNWLVDFARYGMVFTRNAPNDNHAAAKVANRIAFIRKTHYVEEFEVRHTPGTSNVAYLSGSLQLHTDLPYYEYVPGAIILHCLVQTDGEGGDSLLSDGLYHAEKLRQENKEAFDLLSSVEVNWLDIGSEHGDKYHTIFRCPVIRLDLQGNIDKIHYSVPQRDSHFTVDVKHVKPWYEALKLFVNSITHGTSKLKLQPGELLAVDNVRLLHGRTSYQDSDKTERYLKGVYIDWDELFSKMRVLKSQK
uniref:Gamma-butyrobetaine dioxygenase n=1 Tax=Photinus pyralis TaxID=7054 RepID=A0A1Y1M8T6_PHOPY